jgi:hypothetical protein
MTLDVPRIAWWEAEPARLQRDQNEIGEAFPELAYVDEGQGRWDGRLPVWPFDRPRPDGLVDLTRGQGLDMELHYGAAYPIVSPSIFPLDPQPQPLELTQTRWHVLGNRALCLFQTQADWDPASSAVDLLIRAAGWRIEYALLKAGVMDDMTMTGIARDDSIDGLIAEAAARLATSDAEGSSPSVGE